MQNKSEKVSPPKLGSTLNQIFHVSLENRFRQISLSQKKLIQNTEHLLRKELFSGAQEREDSSRMVSDRASSSVASSITNALRRTNQMMATEVERSLQTLKFLGNFAFQLIAKE